MNKIIYVALFLSVIFSGCSIKNIETKADDYRLEPTLSVSLSDKKDERILRVQRVEGDKAVITRSILYKQNGALNPYKYGRWSELPSTRLQQIFVESLEVQKIFTATVAANSLADADLVLESTLQNFEEVVEGEKSFVHVKLRFRLIQRKDAKILGSISLDSLTNVTQLGASGVVLALNESVGTIINDLSTWLKEIK
jgi:cholesterol transport system auxiliary component